MRMRQLHSSHFAFLVIAITLLFSGCKKDDAAIDSSPLTDLFYRRMTALTFEVVYEPGAEPFDVKTNGGNTWQLTEVNIEALFARRPLNMDVTVPGSISEMRQIPDQNKTGFSLNEIKDIASVYRTTESNETTGNIFIIFLNGYFEQADTLVTNIMGLNIVGTTITVIFKPLINASHATHIVREFVEQSVIIHETAHALGLVNNGVPLTTAHADGNHPTHCSNEDCVMYWQNERTATTSTFIQNFFQGNFPILFGEECLQDTREYFPE